MKKFILFLLVLVTATGIDIHTFDPEGREMHAWRKEIRK